MNNLLSKSNYSLLDASNGAGRVHPAHNLQYIWVMRGTKNHKIQSHLLFRKIIKYRAVFSVVQTFIYTEAVLRLLKM
ncbi:MAG: hypothetical protein V1709_02730 [Planctomycetota bacterium]